MQLPVWISEVRTSAPADEADLIERAKRDRGAFATLYRTHYAAVAGYVRRRTGDVHATDDLVAETFLAALRGLPRYRWRGVPLRAWLLRIATHEVNRWVRRRGRQPVHLMEAADVSAPGTADAESARTANMVRQALLQLHVHHQTVLALHYLEGLSLPDVAAVTGWRLGTVKSRFARARTALQAQLTPRRTG